jgi:tetratricopeptide (TPR) repeat protein
MLGRLALALSQRGASAEGYRMAQRAVAEHERLARIDPADRQSRMDVATARSDAGITAFFAGDANAALTLLSASVSQYEDLAGSGSVTVDFRSDFGVALRRTGDVLAHAGRRAEAVARYQAAVAQLAQSPRDFEYEAELAVAQARLGEMSGGAAADRWLQQSLDTWRLAEGRGVRAGRMQPGGSEALARLISVRETVRR